MHRVLLVFLVILLVSLLSGPQSTYSQVNPVPAEPIFTANQWVTLYLRMKPRNTVSVVVEAGERTFQIPQVTEMEAIGPHLLLTYRDGSGKELLAAVRADRVILIREGEYKLKPAVD